MYQFHRGLYKESVFLVVVVLAFFLANSFIFH